MSNTITFHNPGLIDTVAFTTFGVNAKENANPIGHFGTGLKYAIAIILRLGGEITIYRGQEKYRFIKSGQTFRGKDFEFIFCEVSGSWDYATDETIRLGYTTELGKGWEAWQAFRELYSNALDEGGGAFEGTMHAPSETQIVVTCPEIAEAFRNKHKYFLSTTPIARTPVLDFHPGESNVVYFRGIAVHELQKPALFTYNLTEPVELTEDRTMKYGFMATDCVKRAILATDVPEIVEACVTAGDAHFEHGFNYPGAGVDPSPTFLDTVGRLLDSSQRGLVNRYAMDVYCSKRGEPVEMPTVKLNREMKQQLERAYKIAEALGYETIRETPIVVVESLGAGKLGCARRGTMYISHRAFDTGTRCLAGTIIEEHLHLIYSYTDMTRDFQNYLVDRLAAAGERLAKKRSRKD
jgi:hypothetical protein